MNLLYSYRRSVLTTLVIAAACVFAVSELRLVSWQALEGFFAWSETTPFGVIGKTWGAAFAIVEAFHLVGLALLGGAVLVGDGRLLGFWFTDLPSQQVQSGADSVFLKGLLLLLATGLFMACGVAMKIYYMPVFWYKMLALATGILFAYGVRRPLLRGSAELSQPWLARLVATASIMIWFTVAACGRWIGFSG
jgi:hypothetical protein